MYFLWIAAYGLTYLLSDCLSGGWAVPPAMLVYTAALIVWIFRTGQHRTLGLCAVRRTAAKEYLEFLPLLLLPVCNLLGAGSFYTDFPTVLLMLSVCAAEEIFFRGFLLRFLMKRGTLSAILLSSAVFALFHCVNLIGGSGSADTLAQVLCAFAVGVCYAAVTVRFESLIPCFAAHFLTNITASGAQSPWIWVCIAVCGCFGIHFCRKFVNK